MAHLQTRICGQSERKTVARVSLFGASMTRFRTVLVWVSILNGAVACGGQAVDDGIEPNPSVPGPGAASTPPPGDNTTPALPDAPATGDATDVTSPGAHDPEPNCAQQTAPGADEPTTGELADCRCSRQCGARNDFRCPRGTGTSKTRLIGSEGGTVELTGTRSTVGVSVRLDIPANALSEPTLITITELRALEASDYVDWSPIYRFEPLGLILKVPAELRMPWSNTDGPIDDVTLLQSASAQGPYEAIADSYTNAGFNQGSLLELGHVFVGVPESDSKRVCQ
jgi:hypothetical protein